MTDQWCVVLQKQLQANNRFLADCTQILRSPLRQQLKSVSCGKCGTKTWYGSLVEFRCPDPKHPRRVRRHALCFDCLEDRLERHHGRVTDRAIRWVVPCEECHCPAAIRRSHGLEGGLDRPASVTRRNKPHYTIDRELTEAVRRQSRRTCYYENQRRGLLSKFAASNLLPLVDRPPKSDEWGNPWVEESRVPLEGEVWLDRDRCEINADADEVWEYGTDAAACGGLQCGTMRGAGMGGGGGGMGSMLLGGGGGGYGDSRHGSIFQTEGGAGASAALGVPMLHDNASALVGASISASDNSVSYISDVSVSNAVLLRHATATGDAAREARKAAAAQFAAAYGGDFDAPLNGGKCKSAPRDDPSRHHETFHPQSTGLTSADDLDASNASFALDGTARDRAPTVTEADFNRRASAAAASLAANRMQKIAVNRWVTLAMSQNEITDHAGWQYALHWPKAKMSWGGWRSTPNTSTFVRQRKRVSLSVLVTDSLRARLERLLLDNEPLAGLDRRSLAAGSLAVHDAAESHQLDETLMMVGAAPALRTTLS